MRSWRHGPGEHESDLVPVLAGLSVAEAQIAMADWAARARASLDDADDEPDRDRRAHLSPTLDGKGRLDANLEPEAYAAAVAALRLAMGGFDTDDTRSPAQRRHDALAAIFVFFLDPDDATVVVTDPTGRRRTSHPPDPGALAA